jgi:enoyl-CoA hydratase
MILTETRGRVGIVTLNNPERLNALHPVMMREFREAMEAFNKDDAVGAIVVTGAGRAFCAGADVKGWGREIDRGEAGNRMAAAARSDEDESMTEFMARLKPIVIAYNGDAIGAGFTITIAADYRIASERARLSMRFARMGVMPELQSTRLLPHMAGLTNALDIMLTGEIIPAQRALELGLVSEVVAPERLVDRAVEKAAQYAKLHPDTTRAVKKLVWSNLWEPSTSEVKRKERVEFAAAQKRPSHREAVQAFVEKREPNFYAVS